MIARDRNIKDYCCEDVSLIENYGKAMADKDNVWECHHRDEIRILPSGMVALRSMEELKENGRYYGCPANELIFLTPSEHHTLHAKYLPRERTKEWAENISKGNLSTFGKLFYKGTGMLPRENRTYYKYCHRYWKESGVLIWEVKNA